MRVRILAFVAGMAIAGGTILGTASPSGAQVTVVASACTSTTATFVQGVGSPRAPILVPMNLPVNVCTLAGNIQVITPAFRLAGSPLGPIAVPSGLPASSCGVSVVVVPAAGTTPGQVLTVSGSPVTVLSPATVVAPLVTCF